MSADLNLDHPAVKLYRDTFKFCPDRGTRNDIATTVTDLDLWKDVLSNWGYRKDGKWIKFNPLSTRKMLSEYERRQQNGTIATVERPRERISDPKASEVGLSERSHGRVRDVREGTGVQLRADRQTLEEIVTKALRQNDQP